MGCLDKKSGEIESKLLEIIGRKIEKIEIANCMMDARFQFEGEYVLKTFTITRDIKQWEIIHIKHLFFRLILPLDRDNKKISPNYKRKIFSVEELVEIGLRLFKND